MRKNNKLLLTAAISAAFLFGELTPVVPDGYSVAYAASMPSTYTKDGFTYNYDHRSGLMGIYYNIYKGYALVTYSDDTYTTVVSSKTGTYTGNQNIVSKEDPYSSVSGGSYNTSIGDNSSVSGGDRNTASGIWSSVSGGTNNTASGMDSSVSGGSSNTARGATSSVSGGRVNTASGVCSSVSGGHSNTASGYDSSVSGGADNTASGGYSSVSGGHRNTANGFESSVLGGSDSVVQGGFSTGIAGGSTGADAENGLAAGYQSVVTIVNGTAIGYQATTDKDGTIAFGHDSGDVSGYTVTWQKDSNGKDDYTRILTIMENKYTSAYYNRLVKIADGVDAHDAVTVEQLNKAVAGSGKTYTAGSDINISSTNAISVKKNGLIASGNTNLVTGNTVYQAIKNMAVYDSDTNDRISLAGTSGTMIGNLKSGALTASSMEAVNGSQLYSTNQAISGFAKDISANTSKLSELSNSVTSANSSATTAVTLANDLDASKADTSLSNLSAGGKSVISAAANEAIQNYFKNNAAVTMSASVAKTMLFRMPMRAPAADTLLDSKADISYVDSGLSKKADISYVDKQLETKADKEDLKKKADITYVNSALSKKADKTYVDKQLDIKADKTFVEAGLKLKADKSYVDKNLVEVNAKIDLKASSDASNIDVNKFTQKLDTGAVEANNKGLVSGSKVYDAVKDKADKGYVDALALGLNQEIAGTAQGLHNEIQQMGNRLNKNINKAAAGSNALSALHPMEYDPNDKMNFAVGYGHYKGANATAIGAYYYPNANTMLSVGTTIGNGSPSVNAGISMKLGKGSAYNGVSKAEMAQRIEKQDEKIAQQQEENNEIRAENQEIKKELAELMAYVKSLKK